MKLTVPITPDQFTTNAIQVVLQPRGGSMAAYQIWDPDGAYIHDPIRHEERMARQGDFIIVHHDGSIEILNARETFERYEIRQAQKLPREKF